MNERERIAGELEKLQKDECFMDQKWLCLADYCLSEKIKALEAVKVGRTMLPTPDLAKGYHYLAVEINKKIDAEIARLKSQRNNGGNNE